MNKLVVRSPLDSSLGDSSPSRNQMECEQFSCELGTIIIEGINPQLKSGNYQIMYHYEENKVTVSFIECEEGQS